MNTGKKYNTKQRDQIVDFFRLNEGTCFTAGDVIERLGGQIGKATIYRCLVMLSKDGTLKRFIADKGEAASYQYNGCNHQSESHFHLKCLSCGEVIHVDCSCMKDISAHIANEHNFAVDTAKTLLYGLCKNCKQG